MIKIGMVIGDRYEILESIGAGGMSDVYKAKDRKLNRFVALKVLKKEFSENKEFVSKFRTEALAAAGLEHQNIVNVYDVGEEDGIYYIVMELVEGITLKRYIEKKQRLSVKESVSIAIQISMGLEAAHNNGIVHRDIKPQNIMISKDGKVKVTDFGIAKATSSNTITSNVMGSVHYASPEQARGGFSDAKSDVYSLGITLFEMLTGRVPFNGETAVAIAIMQIQNEMPSPRKYVPEIPVSVEQIVLKCCQKSPDRRYQKMSELVEDLKKSLISPDEDFVKIDSIESKSATRDVTEKEREMIKRRSTGPGYSADVISAAEAGGIALTDTEKMSPRKKSAEDGSRSANRNGNASRQQRSGSSDKGQRSSQPGNRKPSSGQKSANAARSKQLSQEAKEKTRKNAARPTLDDEDEDDSLIEKLKTVIIVVIAVVIGCIVLYFAGLAMGIFGNGGHKLNFGNKETKEEEVTVPTVVNYTLTEAIEVLTKEGLGHEEVYEKSATVESNHVIATSPAAGQTAAKGTKVTIYVSMEGDGVAVPSVVGQTEAEATSKLEAEGFRVIKEKEYSSGIVKGNVISQSPEANSLISRDGSVTIVISLGPDKSGELKMPSLLNMTEDNARGTLTNMGLICAKVTEVYSDTVAEGLVCEQSITVGATVMTGTEVEIKISKGQEKKYYNCDISVSQPPKYTGGQANVVLKTPDDKELFNTTTDQFPVHINLSNIFGVAGGTVIVRYTVYVPQEVVDEAGNVSVQNVEAIDEYKYDVTFTDAGN
ncbi:MAG: Stk1 family PASTA domain-containing Ser/Thr kinase [Lachnospiraceae bacterium]|nr:Stk1 family PASTA domain-containing Ser/Thr kinase [Lachnospiraceae bacterium]